MEKINITELFSHVQQIIHLIDKLEPTNINDNITIHEEMERTDRKKDKEKEKQKKRNRGKKYAKKTTDDHLIPTLHIIPRCTAF